MPSNLFVSNRAASSAISSFAAQLQAGFIDIYAGTQPVDANTNTTGAEFILFEITFPSPPGSVASSTFTAGTLPVTTCTSTGIAAFYRAYTSSRAAVIDGSVSTAGADMNFNTNNIVVGVSGSVTSYVLNFTEH